MQSDKLETYLFFVTDTEVLPYVIADWEDAYVIHKLSDDNAFLPRNMLIKAMAAVYKYGKDDYNGHSKREVWLVQTPYTTLTFSESSYDWLIEHAQSNGIKLI